MKKKMMKDSLRTGAPADVLPGDTETLGASGAFHALKGNV
jgi:hypothetical protein